MEKLIGFAEQFYTLWNYEEQPTYRTDSYGVHHKTGVNHNFYYIKNISKDIDKVKSLYPNIIIDEDLRGKIRSFNYQTNLELPENYFWYGKYSGKLIDDVLKTDFNYCLWASENTNPKTMSYIKNHIIYISYFDAIEKEKQDKINSKILLKAGDTVELDFISNGYNSDEEYTLCWVNAVYNDLKIKVICNGVKPISGKYPYLMPIINDKAQRTKGKNITITVTEVLNTDVYDDIVSQIVKIL